jgi:AcrR family transcriptional regulator
MLSSHRTRGSETQSRILERAVQIASVEGLDAMSLATLAEATHMSKSGLFAHFRSKEALQLAIVDEAERMFRAVVVEPALAYGGFARFRALIEQYIAYAAGSLFQGGCFFAAAVHEFDGRPGPVRDRLAAYLASWNSEVRAAIEAAKASGEVSPTVSSDQVVFWATGLGLAVNWNAQMGSRENAIEQAKLAVIDFLEHLKAHR